MKENGYGVGERSIHSLFLRPRFGCFSSFSKRKQRRIQQNVTSTFSFLFAFIQSEDSIAYNEGSIHQGDRLLEVNGVNLKKATQEEACKALKVREGSIYRGAMHMNDITLNLLKIVVESFSLEIHL